MGKSNRSGIDYADRFPTRFVVQGALSYYYVFSVLCPHAKHMQGEKVLVAATMTSQPSFPGGMLPTFLVFFSKRTNACVAINFRL